MKSPKLLSWVASQNRISDELALKLWRRAAGEAEAAVGGYDSSRYYQDAIARFVFLAEQESTGQRPFRSLWFDQLNLLQLNLGAVQRMHEALSAIWLSPSRRNG
jgi:hypothetical protein